MTFQIIGGIKNHRHYAYDKNAWMTMEIWEKSFKC